MSMCVCIVPANPVSPCGAWLYQLTDTDSLVWMQIHSSPSRKQSLIAVSHTWHKELDLFSSLHCWLYITESGEMCFHNHQHFLSYLSVQDKPLVQFNYQHIIHMLAILHMINEWFNSSYFCQRESRFSKVLCLSFASCTFWS